MKSQDTSSPNAAMPNDMMGAAGLVPPGIMVGKAGRWMVGYQVMFDKMDGNLVGSRRISDAAILERFFATPTDMKMQMHMGMVMYAPSDKLTLMAMVPYVRKTMNHVTADGMQFTEDTTEVSETLNCVVSTRCTRRKISVIGFC